MPQPQTFLHCSRRTATIILLTIFLLFLTIGCAAMLRKTGLQKPEVDRLATVAQAEISAAAAEAVTDIQQGITQGQDLKTVAIRSGSAFAWKMATLAASTIGAVLSGLLAKWLGTERKMNAALITGIEKGNSHTVKKSVKNESLLAGVQSKLHRRVKALT